MYVNKKRSNGKQKPMNVECVDDIGVLNPAVCPRAAVVGFGSSLEGFLVAAPRKKSSLNPGKNKMDLWRASPPFDYPSSLGWWHPSWPPAWSCIRYR